VLSGSSSLAALWELVAGAGISYVLQSWKFVHIGQISTLTLIFIHVIMGK